MMLHFQSENRFRKFFHIISFFCFFFVITVLLFFLLNLLVKKVLNTHDLIEKTQYSLRTLTIQREQVEHYKNISLQEGRKQAFHKQFSISHSPSQTLEDSLSHIQKSISLVELKHKIDKEALLSQDIHLFRASVAIEILSSNDRSIYQFLEHLKEELPGYLITRFFHLQKVRDPLFVHRILIRGVLIADWLFQKPS